MQPIAERLGSLGYSVWWERDGQARFDEIERQYGDARAVVTVWSESARNSPRVLAQSVQALDDGKLLQMRLDTSGLPAPFETLKVSEMHSGKSEWGLLEDALARLVREGRSPETADHRALRGAQPGIVVAPRLLLAAVTSSLVAFAGALTAGFDGVMRPDQLQLAMFGVLAVGALCAAVAALRLTAIRRAES